MNTLKQIKLGEKKLGRRSAILSFTFVVLFVALFQFSHTATVVEGKSNYKNPFSSFKIGDKDFASGFKKSDSYDISDYTKWDFSLKGKKTVKIKMKSGYKFEKMTYTQLGVYTKSGEFKETKLKNGSKLNFSKAHVWELHVTYRDKKNKRRTAALLFPTYY